MKRFFLLWMSFILTTVLWAYNFQSGDLYYNITSSTAPYTVEVTYQELGDDNYKGLTSVSIPATVTYNNKTYSVTSIGYQAFSGCTGLTSITIPESVTSIKSIAFRGCTGLTSITIPESVTSISNAFWGCTGLTSITIPESVTRIGNSAFSGCTGLTSITIPNSVTSIGEWAFRGCTGLTFITIPESVTSIGSSAFSNCTGLTSITIPKSVTSIGDFAFWDCTGLTSITIPNSVASIGSSAFGCTGLTSITIPESVTSVGNGAFRYCTALTSLIVDKDNIVYDSRNNCNAIIETGSNTLVASCKTTIIPNSVTSIGDNAFWDCTGLTSITIPNSVTSIGENAFWGCTGLTSITIPNSVTSIGWNVFSGCTSLSSITIPNSVTSIGAFAFDNVPNIVYNGTATGSPWGAKSVNGYVDGYFVYADATKTTLLACYTTATGAITIPNSVTSISNAFRGCTGLTSITIPNSVTSIGSSAFSGCTGLTSITIPNSVTSIGFQAFQYCTGLTSITIPNSVTSIGYYAFSGCTGLTSITIPNSVTSIGFQAFDCCTGLTSVTIPESVTSIGSSAFSGCTSLTSLIVDKDNIVYDSRNNCNAIIETGSNTLVAGCKTTIIPNSVTNIGEYAFSGCTGLTAITIPNSVTSIGSSAFFGCTGLTSITIPESVTSIGYYAFSSCTGLTSIQVEAQTPPQCGTTSFDYVPKDIPVYIPCGTKEAYQTADTWSSFTNYIETPPYLLTVTTQDETIGFVRITKEATCADNTAVFEATANEHYHFTHWSDGNTENPRVLTVTQDTTLIAYFVQVSGKCGDNLYWEYASKTLTVTGTGAMYDYGVDSATASPWLLFRDSIATITFPDSMTYIGTDAFYKHSLLTEVALPDWLEEIGNSAFAGCTALSKVEIGSGIATIGENAFCNSRKLYEIHIAATEPPIADRTSFLNYNVHLYVPCESKEQYDLDMVFGYFKYIECTETDKPLAEFSVTPAKTSAKFVWGAPSNAATYTLELQQEDAPFFTLVFNTTGQLQSISLAPIGSQVRLSAADNLGNGFAFEATGLTQNTRYNYTLTTADIVEAAIETHEGYFYTTSDIVPTDTEETVEENTSTPHKVLIDGQVYILRNGKMYTLTGVEVE